MKRRNWFHSLWAFSTGLTVSLASLAIGSAQSIPTLDPNFQPALTRPGGLASAVAVQTDGKIVLAGAFNAIGGVARNGLARLNADGSVDPAFAAGAICCGTGSSVGDLASPISALLVQRDGRILIGGSFSMVNGVARNGLARLNSDGSLDTTFNPGSGLETTGGLLPVAAFLEQPDGKIIVGGFYTAINGVARSGLARLNPDGSVDTEFDPGTALAIGFPDFGPITGLALLPSGQIIVAGAFQAFDDVKRPGLARLNANGSLDHDFVPEIYQVETPPAINGLVVQPDGKMVISGSFNKIEPEFRTGLGRLNADGTVDLSFDPPLDHGNEFYTVLGLQSDGKIAAFRQHLLPAGTSRLAFVRLNTDGTLDPTLDVELASDAGGRLDVRDTALQADSRWLVAGNLSAAANPEHRGVIRIQPGGQLDTSFRPRLELAEAADAEVSVVAAQPDGKVVVGGSFSHINGVARELLARLNADGSVDTSFAPGIESEVPQGSVSALLLQSDGKILVGGLFTSVNGVTRNGIARLNPDGSLDTSFDPGSGTFESEGIIGHVSALAVQPDGKVLLGGDFSTISGQSIPWLARLDSDGTLDTAFRSAVGECRICDPPEIGGVGVLSNGVIMVSGRFDRTGLARLQPDGSLDFAFPFTMAADEVVTAMTIDAEGNTTVASTAPDASGQGYHSRFQRFLIDGSVDPNFQPQPVVGQDPVAVPVSALRADAQGRMLVGGAFTSIGGVPRHGLARLNPDGTLDTAFDAGPAFGSGIFQLARNQDSLVNSLDLLNDGSILAGGNFATVNGQTRLGLAKFLADPAEPGGGSVRFSSLSRAATGAVSMLVSGEPGQTYRIEASSDLRAWTSLGTVTGAATPQSFSDPGASTLPHRFYRAVSP